MGTANTVVSEGRLVEDDEQPTDGRSERDYDIGRLMAFSDIELTGGAYKFVIATEPEIRRRRSAGRRRHS